MCSKLFCSRFGFIFALLVASLDSALSFHFIVPINRHSCWAALSVILVMLLISCSVMCATLHKFLSRLLYLLVSTLFQVLCYLLRNFSSEWFVFTDCLGVDLI